MKLPADAAGKRLQRTTPGPQRVTRRNVWGAWWFGLLFACVAAAFVQALVKANLAAPPQSWLLALNLLSVEDALRAFIAIVALLYTRAQIADGLKPYLVYEGDVHGASATGLPVPTGDSVFRITLKNVGLGAAYITGSKYHIQQDGRLQPDLGYEELLDIVRAKGLVPGLHLTLRETGTGYALPKDGALVVFEILLSRWQELALLDIELHFRGAMGHVWSKDVFCIPRNRASRFPA